MSGGGTAPQQPWQILIRHPTDDGGCVVVKVMRRGLLLQHQRWLEGPVAEAAQEPTS